MGFVTPEDKQGMAGYGSYEAVLHAVEGAVAGGWLTGDRFTAADLYLASHLSWGMQFGSVERRPAFEAYVASAIERPAHKRASALDDAALPSQPQ